MSENNNSEINEAKPFCLEVTQEDIDNGVKGDFCNCPIAHSIKRALSIPMCSVYEDKALTINNEISMKDDMVKFIKSFDKGEIMTPQIFNTDIKKANNFVSAGYSPILYHR